MKGAIEILLMFIIATTSIYLLFNSFIDTHKHEAVVTAMIESGKIAVIESQDHSSRVQERTSNVSKGDFERAFEEAIATNLNINLSIQNINYRYLEIEGDIKAIDIELEIENGETFKTTFKQNLSETE